MVPHKLTFEESLHACKKLSGSLASYVNKTEFDDIVYFVSLTKNMNSQGCIEKLEDGNNIEVWAGGMDDRQEGLWETWNTREPIKVNLHYICIECYSRKITNHPKDQSSKNNNFLIF